MSVDMVDLLHDAEERVVALERLLSRVADGFAIGLIDDGLVADVREAIEPPYCRSSCEDDDAAVHDDDCGCPCHWQREP